MKRWELKPIGDVCTIVNGGTPKTGISEYWDGEHLWITPSEMGKRPSPYAHDTARKLTDKGLEDCSAKLLPPRSVILSSRAPIGHLVINTAPMATNHGCKGLIPSRSLDHKFLFYYLGSIVEQLNDLGTGATFKELSGGKLKEVGIPLPPLDEQQRIVAILDEGFAGLVVMRQHAEANLKNARALFDSHLNAAFSSKTEQVNLAELAAEITDGDHMPPPKSDRGVPFITISDIKKHSREIDFSDTFFVPESYFTAISEIKKPKIGDILYTVTGATLGIPVLIKEQTSFCFQRHIGLVRPKPMVDSIWLSYALLSPHVFQQATERSTGAAQKTVSLSVLRTLNIPKHSGPEQRLLATRLSAFELETNRLESLYRQKVAAIDELKQAILHRAFSGALSAKDALAA